MKRAALLAMGAVALAWLAAAPSGTLAQDKYPSKPIRVIVPYGPGGGTDIVARIVTEHMRHALGQQFLIENKPGANGLLGLEELLRSKPDGYTLVLANQTVNVIAPMLYPKRMKVDVEKALIPVVRLAEVPNLLTVNKDFPPKTFQEFIDYARKNPGKVRYTSTGVGSFPHFDTEILARRAKIQLIHVPNAKGAAASSTDLATGDANVGFLNVATAGPMIRSGNVRPIAIADKKRSPDYPDVPTLAELGYPGIGTVQWFAFLTIAGVPDEVIAVLHKAAVEAVNSKDVQEAFRKQGITSTPSDSPAAAKAWVASEYEHWRKVFKEVPIQIDN
ncbi:MAG: tripartite tricarboxylate transporter substrate binding protein [Variibacter sp.]|nr:tripartite tricarboxylate transporter substrate binding protein [Variibacter sp.]